MFGKHEIPLGRRVVLRLPAIEGKYSGLNLPSDFCLSARIARPLLSNDVLELRSAHARTPGRQETHFFDSENRSIGRRVQQPFQTTLSEAPEDAEVYEASPLSVGGATTPLLTGDPLRGSGNVTHITHE